MTGSASRSDRRSRQLTGLAVLLGAVAGALLTLLAADWERRTLFDTWQRIAPRTISDERVAVVLIDSLSLEAVGSWPWSRYYMARLTESIALQQPNAIGFDIVFAEPDALDPTNFSTLYPELDPASAQQINALPSMDRVFAQVIGSAPVLLVRLGVDNDGIDPAQLLVDPPIAGNPPPGTMRSPQVLTSIPELDDVALAHAMFNGPPDKDGTVRRVPLSVVAGRQTMPGLAVELARIAQGVPQLEWQEAGLRMGGVILPADATGSLPIRMGHLPAAAVYSAAEVLADKIPADAFTNKIVLVGLGAEGTADIVATPLATEIFGVLVQAQAVDAILAGGWLSRPPWIIWWEIGSSFALVLLIFFAGATRRNWLLAPALLLALALPFASWLLFDRANLLFDPVRPILIGACAAIAMWITLYALARSERARLAMQLVDERVSAAEQEGELRAARRIQLGMVPGAERLAGLDPRVGIGAVLRPAKTVGGDFYDVLMVSPDRLLFLVGDVTGKGVPAALYMALSKALSKSVLSRSTGDLGQAVSELNRELMAEADDEMGVTMLVGVLDCASGEVSFVNAGHENPIVVQADRVKSLELMGGPPLCVIDFAYPEERATLAQCDTLVLITDGATEAQNAVRDLFGLDGVIAALEAEGEMAAADRATDLADRIRAFEGDTESSDDLTIVTLYYGGQAPPDAA